MTRRPRDVLKREIDAVDQENRDVDHIKNAHIAQKKQSSRTLRRILVQLAMQKEDVRKFEGMAEDKDPAQRSVGGGISL